MSCGATSPIATPGVPSANRAADALQDELYSILFRIMKQFEPYIGTVAVLMISGQDSVKTAAVRERRIGGR
jgi:hypothetical protein